MITLQAATAVGEAYDDDLFGANILATRDALDAEGTYADAVETLGVTNIRYPGGSLTEKYFDITDPTAETATDPDTGETVDFLAFDDFMSYAAENDLSVTVVLPTRHYLSEEVDANGDSYAAIDEDALRQFVQDTLDGVYGEASVSAFEIGNEYWGSGEMSSVEYGRVASEMSAIVDDEVEAYLEENPEAGAVDIIVQVGANYGEARLTGAYEDLGTGEDQLAALSEDYGMDFSADEFLYDDGSVAWPKVANALVTREFDTSEEIEAVDGVALHIYGKGLDNENSWGFDYNMVEQYWDETFDDPDRYVTEWNSKTVAYGEEWQEEYGLKSAQEMLNITETMVANNVDMAQVWAVQQNTATDLAGDEGSDSDLTINGEMFKLMAETLPDTYAIQLEEHDAGQTESTQEGASVHLFANEDKVAMFIGAGEDGAQTTLDLNELMSETGNVTIKVLGVADGENPTDQSSDAKVTEIDASSLLDDGVLSVDLKSWEVMVVEFEDPELTQDLSDVVAEADAKAEAAAEQGAVEAPDAGAEDLSDADQDTDLDTGDQAAESDDEVETDEEPAAEQDGADEAPDAGPDTDEVEAEDPEDDDGGFWLFELLKKLFGGGEDDRDKQVSAEPNVETEPQETTEETREMTQVTDVGTGEPVISAIDASTDYDLDLDDDAADTAAQTTSQIDVEDPFASAALEAEVDEATGLPLVEIDESALEAEQDEEEDLYDIFV